MFVVVLLFMSLFPWGLLAQTLTGGLGMEETCLGSPMPCTSVPRGIPNGQVKPIKDMENKVALEFICNDGFILMGEPILTCCGRYWESAYPKCVARDCKTHLHIGNTQNGTHIISPDGKSILAVHCDMTTAGGGWTVIQRRVDGSTNFSRNWNDYKEGFGVYNHNYWMGLENIHALTKQDSELYFYLEAGKEESRYAQYSSFQVGSELDKYRLKIAGYTGTAGDCSPSGYMNNVEFSTLERDNDKQGCCSCAAKYKGGWWYSKCHFCNPNGLYLNGPHPDIYAAGIDWQPYKGYHYSMTYIEMKIRRK